MNDQERLEQLLARQRAVRAELDSIDAEIQEIEERRFPKQKRPIFTLIKGGAVAAAIATAAEKIRKHPGIAASLAGGALVGGLILGQLPGDEDQIISDPQKEAPGVSVPAMPPPSGAPETPGQEPSAAPEAPSGPPVDAPAVPVQDPQPDPTGGPEGPPEPTSEPTGDEPEPSPEPTVPAPPSPTQPPSPSPSPTATPTVSPSPTPSVTAEPPEPPTPADESYLLCLDADLSLLELELCLLELGISD